MKSTFVLVHGAFHGAWCWKPVSDELRRSGHEVYTPTLTGLGERAHLAHPGITLDTHITDVCRHRLFLPHPVRPGAGNQ